MVVCNLCSHDQQRSYREITRGYHLGSTQADHVFSWATQEEKSALWTTIQLNAPLVAALWSTPCVRVLFWGPCTWALFLSLFASVQPKHVKYKINWIFSLINGDTSWINQNVDWSNDLPTATPLQPSIASRHLTSPLSMTSSVFLPTLNAACYKTLHRGEGHLL